MERVLPRRLALPRINPVTLAPVAVVLGFLGIYAVEHGSDSWAYYNTDLLDPYHDTVYGTHTFLYSPAFNLAWEPLRWLPWGVSHIAIVAAEIGALVWLVGWPIAALLLIADLEPLYVELSNANLNLVAAALVVASLRYPALWSALLLSKVTPGIGLVWHLVRREWRSLGIALGVTFAIALPTLLLWPGQWVEWFGLLASSSRDMPEQLGTPLIVRGIAALGLVAWGAHTGRAWTVPVAVALSMPVTWVAPIMALGAVRLYRSSVAM